MIGILCLLVVLQTGAKAVVKAVVPREVGRGADGILRQRARRVFSSPHKIDLTALANFNGDDSQFNCDVRMSCVFLYAAR